MPISTSKEIVLEKLSVPLDGILHCEENVTCFNKNTNVGSGRLFVTERSILWLNGENLGFNLDYQKMNMHAISRNINSFPHPCIYVMLEPDINDNDNTANDDKDEDSDDDDDDDIREIRFAPANAQSLDDIYNAMRKGNELNPDPNDSNSGEEDDEEFEGDEGQGDGGHDIVANGNGVSNECEDEAPVEGQFDDDDDVMES